MRPITESPANPKTRVRTLPDVPGPRGGAAVVQRIQKKVKGVARFIKYWLPVILYAILIFYLSCIPGKEIPFLFSYQDVVTHILEYAFLALLLNRALKAYYPTLRYGKRFLWVVCLSLMYALSDEFHQKFVPQRVPSFYDVAYDGIGIVLANILYRR